MASKKQKKKKTSSTVFYVDTPKDYSGYVEVDETETEYLVASGYTEVDETKLVYEPVLQGDKYVTVVKLTYGVNQEYMPLNRFKEQPMRYDTLEHSKLPQNPPYEAQGSIETGGSAEQSEGASHESSRSEYATASSEAGETTESNESMTTASDTVRRPSQRRQYPWNQKSQAWKKQLGKLNQLRVKDCKELVKGLKQIAVCTDKAFVIGSGCFGTTVYVGLKNDGQEVAVKRLSRDNMPPNIRKQWKKHIETEVNNLVRLRPHGNIVSYKLTEWPNRNCGYIVTELCEYSLDNWLKVIKLSDEEWNREFPGLWKDVLSGLNHLHTHDPKFLHRDIKPQNILVEIHNEKAHLKLADFGISRVLDEEQTTLLTGVAGTRGWRAAEVIKHPEKETFFYKDSVDVQVCGMVLYYIASRGIHPFHDEKGIHHKEVKIVDNKPNLSALDKQPIGKDLVIIMLDPLPEARPSTTVLLRHSFFWSEEKRYKLLTSVGKEPEIADSHEPQHEGNAVRREIEDVKAIVLPNRNDWEALRKKMEKGLDENVESDAKFLTRFQSPGYVDSMCNLLGTMRKLHNHYAELSPRAKAMLGKTCYPYKFFDTQLPGLFLTIYTIIKKSATTQDDWTKRETLMDFFFN